MRIILKSFLFTLKKFKLASTLSIIGLSAAFTVVTICILQICHDLSFNKNFAKSGDIYQLVSKQETSRGLRYGIAFPNKVSKLIGNKFPELKNICYYNYFLEYDISINRNEHFLQFTTTLQHVSPSFLDIFQPKVLLGNAEEALKDKGKAMISASLANKLYKKENPIGRTIFRESSDDEANPSRLPLTVVAVYEDFPSNCSLYNGIFTHLETSEDDSYSIFCEIDNRQYATAKEKLNTQDMIKQYKLHPSLNVEDYNNKIELEVLTQSIELETLSNIQLRFPLEMNDKGVKKLYVVSLIAITAFILIVAFINFLNFLISLIPARLKTIHIQKILGADSKMISRATIVESTCFVIISFFITLFIIQYLLQPHLVDILTVNANLKYHILLVIFIGGVLLIANILVTIYPISIIKRINGTTTNLLGFSTVKKLRMSLTTVQFMVTFIVLVIAIFVKLQYGYMKDFDGGIQKENIVFVQTQTSIANQLEKGLGQFNQDVMTSPDIMDCTNLSYVPMTNKGSPTYNLMFVNQTKLLYLSMGIEPNFFDFFKLEIKEGNSMSSINREKLNTELIVNESLVRQVKSLSSSVSEIELGDSGEEVIGVVKDFNYEILTYEIHPLVLHYRDAEKDLDNENYSFFKISNNKNTAIKYLESIWIKHSSEPFKLHFLDQSVSETYKREEDVGKLVNVFAIIAVVITLMGAYGIITFNSKYKTKEIAIRKVQGATELQIMLLLNKDLLIQYLIAFSIGSPIAYYWVNSWFEQFVYKAPIFWWVFLLSAGIILIITILIVSRQSYRAANSNPILALNKE